MNVTKENINDLNAVLKIEIVKDDYEEKVTNVLKDYRKKANMPGFRPGKVPFGLVNKMYRLPVLQDEINKLVSESISKYIIDENLKILGEPLPNFNKSPEIDWETQDNFEFVFDVALQPVFDVDISKKIKAKQYKIKVEDQVVKDTVDNYKKRFGSLTPTDKVEQDEMIKADLTQLDKDGKEMENGIKTIDAVMSLERMKDKKIKAQFVDKKVGDTLTINLKKAFDNDTEIAGLLKIKKEETENINSDYNLVIKEISKFIDAEVNQEFFDKVYGKDTVKSEEEFKNKIIEDLNSNYQNQSNYKLSIDIKDLMIENNKIELPAEFLKRWLKVANKEKITDEQLEEEFPKFENDLKWQLIKNKLVEENKITVSEDEVKEAAKKFVLNQFMQYGLANVENEYVDNYTNDILKKEEEKKRFYEQIYEEKIINFIKESIKIDDKEISKDDFYKLFENK